MSEHEETAEAPKEEIEEVVIADKTEAAVDKEEPAEELQQETLHQEALQQEEQHEKKDGDAEGDGVEVPADQAPGVDLKTPDDAEVHIEIEEAHIDESHGIDLIETDKEIKEDDDIPIISVSFADVGIKDIEDVAEEAKSITSVMSYDSVGTVDGEVKARAALGSIISIRRGSAAGGEYYDRHRVPKYMNSYKLEPDKPFHVEKVEKFMREILTEALKNATYDEDKTPKQAKWASSAMRAKLKEQEYDRCKFICVVTMGEKRSQDVNSIIRFLWDPDRDKFAHVVHENMSVFAVAVCFGIYYE